MYVVTKSLIKENVCYRFNFLLVVCYVSFPIVSLLVVWLWWLVKQNFIAHGAWDIQVFKEVKYMKILW